MTDLNSELFELSMSDRPKAAAGARGQATWKRMFARGGDEFRGAECRQGRNALDVASAPAGADGSGQTKGQRKRACGTSSWPDADSPARA